MTSEARRTTAPRPLPAWLQLLRPRQAAKSLIVLVPLVFSGHAFDPHAAARALAAFAGFVLVSMGVYCANDVLDAARDRLHPQKRHRPVASGAVSPATALLLAAATGAAGLGILASINGATLMWGITYILVQVAYNAGLKHVMLWDVLALAIGFVVRALAGTSAIAVGQPTVWLVVCTFLFALHLGLAKRRRELRVLQGDGGRHRASLAHYTVAYVESLMVATTAILLVAYSLYCVSNALSGAGIPGTSTTAASASPAPPALMLASLPFAFYGIFRFNWLVSRDANGDETDVILRDRATLVNAAAWLLVVAAARSELVLDLARRVA